LEEGDGGGDERDSRFQIGRLREMKTRELIKELLDLPPDLPVVLQVFYPTEGSFLPFEMVKYQVVGVEKIGGEVQIDFDEEEM